MATRPVGGVPHQFDTQPAGRYRKSERTSFQALQKKIWKSQKFEAASRNPNPSETSKATKAALRHFAAINETSKGG